ncbi:Catalase [Hyella patelloides LEGE 07179]|uniref:catalase n=1 Tax=Hyella patelloides LEGE 07179 TaxID=945734 RepID=A0A563VM19_9CYAN|nr:catalase [Hyella patelloides]VEP12496.1 Catalase [Hyella patelloides LEGE 07179]
MKLPKLYKGFSVSLTILAIASIVIFANVSHAQSPVESTSTTILTRDNGAPVGDNQNSQVAGDSGPVLLQDTHLVEKLARFDRERIPERVVHARGIGVHGEFVSSADLSDITVAAPFEQAGKETPVFVRFSSVINSKGSPETIRDPRGFATKFYTEQGNWDIVGNNLPVFFIRDAIKFPDLIHSLKPSPITHKQDPNRFFDFFSNVPESTHMLTRLYSDFGTPKNYREMNGSSVNVHKFVNDRGEFKYVKFTWKSNQGEHNYTAQEAQDMQATDFNAYTTDLYDNIAQGNYPSWDLYIQTIDPSDINNFAFNPLDDTKDWYPEEIPEQKVGTMTLNRIPDNFFQETEQSAFAPSNMIPGVEASEDRMLQGRLFSYADTHRHRLGVNNQMLPINRPRIDVVNGNQDGFGNIFNTTSDVNYQPSRREGSFSEMEAARASQLPVSGTTQQQAIEKTLNFQQAGDFYRKLDEVNREHLISNLAGDLGKVEDKEIRTEMAAFFYKADRDYGTKLAQAVDLNLGEVQQRAAELEE